MVSGVFVAGSLLVVGAARASDGGATDGGATDGGASDAGIDGGSPASDGGRNPGGSDTGVLPCGIAHGSPPSRFGLALMAVGIASAVRRRRSPRNVARSPGRADVM
jgi:MYXO-CTERM domain-containing protein